MADKKKPTNKVEREYIVNLRKEVIKAPRHKKAKKAINALKAFLSKHMKSEDVKLGPYLNEHLWQNGPKNPPTRVEVRVTKEDEKVFAELKSAPEEKKEDKKEKKKIIEKKEEKEKQVDMSLVDKQKKVAKEKKKEEVPKAAELKEKKEKK